MTGLRPVGDIIWAPTKGANLKMATLTEQFVVDSKGKKTAVLLPIKRYQELMEDVHDLAVVAERRNEKPISLEEMKRRLKKHGLV